MTLAAIVPIVVAGCSYPGAELDFVARSLDKYGTVTISGATLIEPDPRFQLDLELTGNQIFERNRIEGFSNISQYDAMDVQVSVKAEIIANLVDQMGQTEDPGLLGQLKQKLMAAAFQGLADQLPEDLQPFANALRNVGPSGTPGGESAASDGGEGLVADAQTT